VLFDAAAFAEDLAAASARGRDVAAAARRDFEREGAPVGRLRPCLAEAADGTRLPNCVKTYLPWPDGRFGMVFAVERRSGQLVLAFLGFGVRHQPAGAHAASVYERAHRRLHGRWPA
jgi:hypothetical protein